MNLVSQSVWIFVFMEADFHFGDGNSFVFNECFEYVETL